MKAAQYHETMQRARRDYEMAQYIDSTFRMEYEQSEALETMRNTWITNASPLPGIRYEGNAERWRPIR